MTDQSANESRDRIEAGTPWYIRTAAAAGVGAVLVLLILWAKGVFGAEPLTRLDQLKAFADAFFMSGMLLICFAALAFLSREGAFDAVLYFFQSVTWLFVLSGGEAKHLTYREYCEQRAQRKKTGFFPILAVGLVYVAAGAVLSWQYMAQI